VGWNTKSIRMTKNRAGIERSLVCPHPKIDVTWSLINQWLANPSLSYKNCLLAAKWVARMRDLPAWQNVEDQKEINFLDERVDAAKQRVQKREERREAKKAEAAGIKPARKSKNKPVPVAPAAPPTDPLDLWNSMLEEKKL
jgi:hypothetical protein